MLGYLKTPLLGASLMMGLAFGGTATAADYLITYSGYVITGYDQTGVFGSPGVDLSGKGYTATYKLTLPTPGALLTTDGSHFTNISGGTWTLAGGSVSPVSAKFTINSVTRDVLGPYVGSASKENNYDGHDGISVNSVDQFFSNHADRYEYSISNNVVSYNQDMFHDIDFSTPFSYILTNDDFGYGKFSFTKDEYHEGYDPETASTFSGFTNTELVKGDLSVSSVTVARLVTRGGDEGGGGGGGQTTGAVPEPSTWAMMIVGFGLMGNAMRRRARMSRQFPPFQADRPIAN